MTKFCTGGVVLLLLALITLPYLLAAHAAGPDFVFGGFLLNPKDGNTYLAKMQQGFQGNWRFRLPYTSEPGEETYLFLFYLFLGHVARISNLSVLSTFHLARVLSAVVLLWALHRFLAAIFTAPRPRCLAFALAALGSGLGWLVIPFGAFTSDFWVAEAYPFLAAYANPHFPLGLALLLWLLTPGNKQRWRGVHFALGALALAIVSPFGVVIAILVWGGVGTIEIVTTTPKPFVVTTSVVPKVFSMLERPIWMLIGGGPVLLYDLWVAHTHPVLAGWNAQNLTPAPPVWDLVVSLSPVLLLALPGAWVARQHETRAHRLLSVWAGAGLVLTYVPVGLQRRFMMGIFVPLAGLAVLGISRLAHQRRRRRILATVILLLSLPTNLMILLTGWHAAQSHDPLFYLARGEAQALSWIADNAPPDALVLAGPETGLFIPAHTGRRVIYGHPFETVDAAAEEEAVTQFFQQAWTAEEARAFLTRRGVDYIFLGPRERALGGIPLTQGVRPVYQTEEVVVYAIVHDNDS